MLPSVRSIILKNFKLLQNDSETGTVFSQPPLISFKRDKNLGNFLVTDHFTSTSANVIYFITCTYCNKLYIGETGKRLGDRFREHLRDVERNDKDASKPVVDTLIFLIILNSIWQFAAYPYNCLVRKAVKH